MTRGAKHAQWRMVGGMVTSTILTLIVIPVIYEMWRGWQMRRAAVAGEEMENA